MRWKTARTYKGPQFKRLVGVERETFDIMVSELKRLKPASKHKIPGKKRGPKPKLIGADEVLMMLMYYREYRTFFHLGSEYGLSESQCWRLVTETEKVLIKSSLFHLPGKKSLLTHETEWEVILVDVAESTIERPKKNNVSTTRERKSGTR
jgi:DDE superfamily endonuclease